MNEASHSTLIGRLLLAGCVGLAACVSTPEKKTEAEPVLEPAPQQAQAAAPEPAPPPPKIATHAEQQQAQRIALKVADLLEAGKVEEAYVEIERALEIDPANRLAQSFLDQLTVDPVQALGGESFEYTVKAGESLSKIAGRYMGDIFRFYILARYNGIDVPRLVPAGRTIRIPGRKPDESELARPEPAPKPVAEKPAKPEPAKPAKPLPSELAKPEPVPAPPVPAATESKGAPAAGERKPVEDVPVQTATPVLKPEPKVPVESEVVAVPSADNTPSPAPTAPAAAEAAGPRLPHEPTPADRAFQRGLREQAQGNNLAAYEAFKTAYSLDPDNVEARSNAELMHKEIVSDYMRRARAAFAKQDLKGSIKNWDLLLEFDPGNDIAQLERQKALVLQERIKSIQ